MPGPGGGGRGGGGFGGGSRGGGFSGGGGGFGGGSRGGGYRHYGGYYGRPYGYGGYYGRRYYGGGCLGGLLGLFMLPIILILMAGMLLVGIFGNAFRTISTGGDIVYQESDYQDYANMRYAQEFGSTSAYEDHMLLVFATTEDCDGYYAITWLGYNIHEEISTLFGDQHSDFGRAVQSSIDDYYAYSLSADLRAIMNTMTDKVVALDLESSFIDPSDQSKTVTSHVSNYTELKLSEDIINKALEDFTAATGIAVVIVIDTEEAVFGRTISGGDIFSILIAVTLIVIAVVLIVRAFRKKKEAEAKAAKDGKGKDNGNEYKRDDSYTGW